jgi:hypothetical protein
MSRKTVSVELLTETVNNICRCSGNDQRDVRQGAMNVLEEILHLTGNYKGFRYLYIDEVESGYSFGINCKSTEYLPDGITERFDVTDCTRVQYRSDDRRRTN